MTTTPQTQAIQNANTIIALCGQLLQLYQQINMVAAAWTDDGTANILNAMATAALNTDGTLGTVDGTPNVAHPINIALYPGLARAVSSNQIAAALTILNNIPLYVNGTAVGATGGVRAILNTVVGG